MPRYYSLGLFPLWVIYVFSVRFAKNIQQCPEQSRKKPAAVSNLSLLFCQSCAHVPPSFLFKCSLVNLHVLLHSSCCNVTNVSGSPFADCFNGHVVQLLFRPRHACLYLKPLAPVLLQIVAKLKMKICSFIVSDIIKYEGVQLCVQLRVQLPFLMLLQMEFRVVRGVSEMSIHHQLFQDKDGDP